jgi:hypothetical protein
MLKALASSIPILLTGSLPRQLLHNVNHRHADEAERHRIVL